MEPKKDFLDIVLPKRLSRWRPPDCATAEGGDNVFIPAVTLSVDEFDTSMGLELISRDMEFGKEKKEELTNSREVRYVDRK